MKKKALFISNASFRLGLGHLKRVYKFSKISFFSNYKKNFLLISNQKNIKSFTDINTKIVKRINLKKILLEDYNFIIFDIANADFFDKGGKKLLNLNKLKTRNNILIFFDSLYPYSLIKRKINFNADIFITPYFINKRSYKFNNTYYLNGPRFFCKQNFTKKKDTPLIGKNIFVTFGGSDINSYSLKILEILDKLKLKLNIKLVIGPFFLKKNISKLQSFNSRHNIKFLYNIKNLEKTFLNSDLVFTSSGITRYEVTSSMIPLIVVYSSKEEKKYNYFFQKKGLSILINLKQNEKQTQKTIQDVITSKKQRIKLKNNCLKVFNNDNNNYINSKLKLIENNLNENK